MIMWVGGIGQTFYLKLSIAFRQGKTINQDNSLFLEQGEWLGIPLMVLNLPPWVYDNMTSKTTEDRGSTKYNFGPDKICFQHFQAVPSLRSFLAPCLAQTSSQKIVR